MRKKRRKRMSATIYNRQNFFGTIISWGGFNELDCEDVFCPYEQRKCRGYECAAFVYFLTGEGAKDEECGYCGMVWR